MTTKAPDEIRFRLRKIITDIGTGDPTIWAQIWIGRNYSKRDLFEDLAALQDAIGDD